MEKIYRLTDNVWILPFDENTDRPNLCYVVSEGKSIIYDAGCGPKNVILLKNELAENGLPLPEKIILSHFHWDHSFGAGYLDGEMISTGFTYGKMLEMKEMKAVSLGDFISDSLMPEFSREHLPMEYNSAADVIIRLPDVVIDDDYTVDVGKLHIDIEIVTSPHCEGQIIRYAREDKVLFLADSFSAEIIGIEFIDNIEKRKLFYEHLKKYDFEYIVLGHFDVKGYDEFWKDANDKLSIS